MSDLMAADSEGSKQNVSMQIIILIVGDTYVSVLMVFCVQIPVRGGNIR